ncbi:MAG: DNA repair protein RadC [Parcubacteria group bacterium LiPW_39]|nr:MAG: DNA repair protein RadC [Parcubacteria group bacterium LiPW_39]
MRIKDLPKIENKKDPRKMAGHRKRLRNRFLQAGLDGFLDYEIVELLLTLGTPRRDCKQMAKEAIKKFKGLRGVLDASLEDLQQIKGIGPHNAFGIKLFQAISERYSKEKIPKKILLDSPKAVTAYLREKIGREKKEHFVILLLDSRNNLIDICNISIGTLNANLVHPREVFEPAVRHSTAQIILAHNHPSGDAEPSEDDLEITKRLVEAGKIMGMDVLDHIIITKTKVFSFKEKGLI